MRQIEEKGKRNKEIKPWWWRLKMKRDVRRKSNK